MGRNKHKSATQSLTAKERAAIYYVVGEAAGDHVKAFRMAYPNSRNWKDATVRKRTNEVFNRPSVAKALEIAWEQARTEQVTLRDQIIAEYKKLAFTDLPGIIDYDSGEIRLEDFKNLSAEQRSVIREFDVETDRKIVNNEPTPISKVKIKLHDKGKALDALGKIEQMFIQKVEHSGAVGAYPASQEQMLAALIDLATPEETDVLTAMAARLTGNEIPDNEPDPIPEKHREDTPDSE